MIISTNSTHELIYQQIPLWGLPDYPKFFFPNPFRWMHFCTSSLHHQVSLSSFLIKHLYCPSHRVILPRTQNLSHLLCLDLVFLSKDGENPSLLHPPLQHHTYSKLITSVPFSSIYPLKASPITTHPPRDTVCHVIQLTPEFLSLLWHPTCGECTLKSHSTTPLWFPASVWNSFHLHNAIHILFLFKITLTPLRFQATPWLKSLNLTLLFLFTWSPAHTVHLTFFSLSYQPSPYTPFKAPTFASTPPSFLLLPPNMLSSSLLPLSSANSSNRTLLHYDIGYDPHPFLKQVQPNPVKDNHYHQTFVWAIHT